MATGRSVICDTNIVIELFKGNNAIIDECLKIGVNNLCISSITVGELYFGALNKREIPKIEKHLERFVLLPINESISSIFASLMRTYCLSHKPFIGDMLIAGCRIPSQHGYFHFEPQRFSFYF